MKNLIFRLLKKISEARRAKKSTSGGVHGKYVGARRLRATKHMRLFQRPVLIFVRK
jgi:hypothetical protein